MTTHYLDSAIRQPGKTTANFFITFAAMKNTLISGLVICLIGLAACKNAEEVKSENAIDAARNFIQSALNGDFEKAATFMVDDSLNRQDLHLLERLSKNLTKEEKDKYKEATIRIHETRNLNDSTTIIHFSNTYKNKKDSLKVVNLNGQWLVDFKYIFKQEKEEYIIPEQGADSAVINSILKDKNDSLKEKH